MPTRTAASATGGRKFYSRIPEILEIPNLIDLQTNSFAAFVGPEWIPGATPLPKGTKTFLAELLEEISPIRDFTGKRLELNFLDYEFKDEKVTEDDARAKDLTYARPLMVNAELKVLETGEIRVGDHRSRIFDPLENTGGSGTKNELFGIERRADGRGHRIGIDVEQRARIVAGEWRNHRHQTVVEQFADDLGIDVIDVADETVIDGGIARLQFDRRALVRLHEAGVDTAETNRRNVELAAGGEDARIDQPRQHHRGRIDRTLIGDASAFHHLCGHAEFLGEFGELRTAAVHEHDTNAE